MKLKTLWLMPLNLGLLTIGIPDTPPVAVQDSQTTGVPFKGLMAEDGNVELILRLYDQAHGGTRLFEEIREAEVRQGVYALDVEVPSEIVTKHPTVWMEVARAAEPDKSLEERTAFRTRRSGEVLPQAPLCLGSCVSLCFTCGGSFPLFSGGIPVPSGSSVIERGVGCDGSLVSRSDPRPQLCSR
jgi:hypothetical protein